MRSTLFVGLLLFFVLIEAARSAQPIVPAETLRKAFKRKNFYVLGLQHSDRLKRLVGLYEPQIPTEIERMEGKLYGSSLALQTGQVQGRAFVFVQSLVGYYAPQGKATTPDSATIPLFRIDAAHEITGLNDGDWIVLNDCTRGNEVLVTSINMKNPSVPLKAWTLDPKTKALVPAQTVGIHCKKGS
jgi:hypothetical protein